MNAIKTPPFPTAADVRPQEAIREDLRRGRPYPVASVSTLCGRSRLSPICKLVFPNYTLAPIHLALDAILERASCFG